VFVRVKWVLLAHAFNVLSDTTCTKACKMVCTNILSGVRMWAKSLHVCEALVQVISTALRQQLNSLHCHLHAHQVLSPEAASLAVKDVLECTDEEAQKHVKTFFEVMDTSPPHVTYTSGTQHTCEMVCMGEKGGDCVQEVADSCDSLPWSGLLHCWLLQCCY